MKRALIVIAVLLVVIVAAVALMPKKKAPVAAPPAHQIHQSAKAAPWDGTEGRAYNITFIRNGHQLTLIDARYRYLSSPSTEVTMDFSTPLSAKSGIPSWLNPRTFIARSTTGLSWLPNWRPEVHGSVVDFTLDFPNLPTALISSQSIGLVVRIGGEPFSLGLVSPPAPPGHRFAENPTRPDLHPPTLQLIKRGGTVKVVSTDDMGLKRVTIKVDRVRTFYPVHGKRFVKVIRFKHHSKHHLHTVEAVALDLSGKHSADKTLRVH